MRVKLVRGSKYRLPISKISVSFGEVVDVTDVEYSELQKIGRFVSIPDVDVKNDKSNGLITVNREPSKTLPENWTNKKIVLKCTAGVGDCIIATGVAKSLKKKNCQVFMAVQEDQVSLFNAFEAIDQAFDAKILNDPFKLSQYDIVIEPTLGLIDQAKKKIVDKEYYTAVHSFSGTRHEGLNIGKILFDVNHLKLIRTRMPKKRPIVAIHAGASNPVRRWSDDKYKQLAYKLRKEGCSIVWLGGRGEVNKDFSFEDKDIFVASKFCKNLLDQAATLFRCDYFIGNDSGFAHLAGIMNIPGLVIFATCKPENVIGKYKSLTGIEAFTRSGLEPTRTLQSTDVIARRCLDEISVQEVFERIDQSVLFKRRLVNPVTEIRPKRVQPNIFNTILDISETNNYDCLSKWFKVEKRKVNNDLTHILNTTDYDAIICTSNQKELLEEVFKTDLYPVPIVYPDTDMEEDDIRLEARRIMGLTWPVEVLQGKILIHNKVLGAGDTVMATSLIRKVREMFPKADIDFAGTELQCELLRNSKDLTSTTTAPTDDYNLVIDLHYYGCWNKGLHLTEGMGGNKYELNLTVESDEKLPTKSILFFPYQDAKGLFKVKEWGTGNWINLITKLKEQGFNCFQGGARFEELIPGMEDFRRDSLEKVVKTIISAPQIVTIEGFAQHVCRSLSKPAIVLWGGSGEISIAGYDSNINIKTDSKNNCLSSICGSTFGNNNCCVKTIDTRKTKDIPCMQGLSVERVFNEIISLYKDKPW